MNTLPIQKPRGPGAFLADETGAVTVDWVVLTAAICGITAMLFSILAPSIFQHGAQSISDVIAWAIAR